MQAAYFQTDGIIVLKFIFQNQESVRATSTCKQVEIVWLNNQKMLQYWAAISLE